MMPRLARAPRAVLLAALALLATAPSAAANIPSPGWAFIRHRNVLDVGRFATNAGSDVAGGGYRFFVIGVHLDPVPPGGRFDLSSLFPSRLIAVPTAHLDRWLDIVAAHEHIRADADCAAARESIPGFAVVRLPRQRAQRPLSSPLHSVETVFRIESVDNGRIRYTTSERRLDADGRPISHAVLCLLGVAMFGLTGLVLTAVRRRRARREAAS